MSVAILVRVLFDNPHDGELMLALEHKATLLENEGGHFVDVKAQPFGGAIRIHDLQALRDFIGDFHFDSEQSRSEQDFRLFIQPAAWDAVQQFCLQHFSQATNSALESDPTRELVEELSGALKMDLRPIQFTYKPVGITVETEPAPTENTYARDAFTVRIYRIFEAHLFDSSLIQAMMTNSRSYSNQGLEKLALEDSRSGGPGWASAVLVLPLKQITALYLATSPENRNRPLVFQGHAVDETVAAVLEGIAVPKYQRL